MLVKRNRIPIKSIILTGFLPSFVKVLIYKLIGYKVGRNVKISMGSVIIGSEVIIRDNTTIGFLTVIRGKQISIGQHVRIGSFTFIDTEKIVIKNDARINEFVIIGGIQNPDSSLKLGNRTIIMEYSYINTTKPVCIGDDTGIGGHCLLFTHGSWLNQLDGFPVEFSPIIIGNNVWLPWRVFIMPGVEIGDNVVIGANSLVNKSLPPNCLAAGSPVKIIKENYPRKPSNEERLNMMRSMLDEFVNHLNYHSLLINTHNHESYTVIEAINNQTNNKMKYIHGLNSENDNCTDYDLILIDNEKYDLNEFINEAKMIVDLRGKERIGTSDLGEEFVSYVSRYGLRFERVD